MTTGRGVGNDAARPHAAARPVPTAQTPDVVNRFAKQLDRAEQKLFDSDTSRAPFTPPARPSAQQAKSPAARQIDDDKPHDAALTPAAAPEVRAGASTLAGGVAAPPALDPAMIEAMAARIAESCAATRDPVFSVALPPGAIANGVILTRGLNDMLAIRIVGFDPRLSTLEEQRLRAGLSEALSRRRLRVGSVTVTRPAEDG